MLTTNVPVVWTCKSFKANSVSLKIYNVELTYFVNSNKFYWRQKCWTPERKHYSWFLHGLSPAMPSISITRRPLPLQLTSLLNNIDVLKRHRFLIVPRLGRSCLVFAVQRDAFANQITAQGRLQYELNYRLYSPTSTHPPTHTPNPSPPPISNDIHDFIRDIITHPCPYFKARLGEPPWRFGYGCVITSQRKSWM